MEEVYESLDFGSPEEIRRMLREYRFPIFLKYLVCDFIKSFSIREQMIFSKVEIMDFPLISHSTELLNLNCLRR